MAESSLSKFNFSLRFSILTDSQQDEKPQIVGEPLDLQTHQRQTPNKGWLEFIVPYLTLSGKTGGIILAVAVASMPLSLETGSVPLILATAILIVAASK